MTKFALLGVLALVSAIAATKVTAQEVIYNPGYCAQFYPNANCQNKGPNSPYTGDYQLRNQIRGAYPWGAGPCAMGADYYVGRGGHVTPATDKGQAAGVRGAIRPLAIPWRFRFP